MPIALTYAGRDTWIAECTMCPWSTEGKGMATVWRAWRQHHRDHE